tara:strand:+ start:1999 stop:2712 length:714 start_codon:yes stop_codon:yes gene_type:complete
MRQDIVRRTPLRLIESTENWYKLEVDDYTSKFFWDTVLLSAEVKKSPEGFRKRRDHYLIRLSSEDLKHVEAWVKRMGNFGHDYKKNVGVNYSGVYRVVKKAPAPKARKSNAKVKSEWGVMVPHSKWIKRARSQESYQSYYYYLKPQEIKKGLNLNLKKILPGSHFQITFSDGDGYKHLKGWSITASVDVESLHRASRQSSVYTYRDVAFDLNDTIYKSVREAKKVVESIIKNIHSYI